jgi:tRNA G18 (ribose-2'-O)-methylase SpoU
MSKQAFPIVVVLDNIRSALNVGAIFRTCDGAGVKKLYLCGITPYPPHNRIPKTALGAIEYVDWERRTDTSHLLNELKRDGYQLIAVEQTTNAVMLNQHIANQPIALVFGHEIAGVSASSLRLADVHVQIPMFGQKESLNVATTAGIVCFYYAFQFANQ